MKNFPCLAAAVCSVVLCQGVSATQQLGRAEHAVAHVIGSTLASVRPHRAAIDTSRQSPIHSPQQTRLDTATSCTNELEAVVYS